MCINVAVRSSSICLGRVYCLNIGYWSRESLHLHLELRKHMYAQSGSFDGRFKGAMLQSVFADII